MTADGLGGQAEGLQDEGGELLAVDRAGHGAADTLVGEGAVRTVQGELGEGGFQGPADGETAQGGLLGGVLGERHAPLLPGAGLVVRGLLVRAVRDGPGPKRLRGGQSGAVGGGALLGLGALREDRRPATSSCHGRRA